MGRGALCLSSIAAVVGVLHINSRIPPQVDVRVKASGLYWKIVDAISHVLPQSIASYW
jgi:hypothetical protein